MTTELVKIDPKEFGLEEKSVKTIEAAFAPKIAEREGYIKVYETLITGELTPELCVEAKALRNKLVKVRTGIVEIHKTQKAFFLASGKFVDAWKNKETLPVTQMESKLSDIEKHFENIEKERIAKLGTERTIELSTYDPEMIIPNIGEMEESVWSNFLNGIKLSFKQRKEAEAKAEAERLRLIEVEKENARLKAIEDEKIRKENARLKVEAEAKEKALAKERKDAEDKLNAQREKSRKEAEQKAAKAAADEKERLAAQKIKDDAAAKILADEKAKAKKLKDQIEAKAAADEKERLAEAAAAAKLAKAPDKDKMIKAINEMTFIDAEFKTAEAQAVYNVINQKFEGFKSWAIYQTKSL